MMICYVKSLANLSVTFGLLRLVHLEENRFGVRASPLAFWIKGLNPRRSSDVKPLWICVAKSCPWLYSWQIWPTTQPTQRAVIHSVGCRDHALSCVVAAWRGTLLCHMRGIRGESFHVRAAKRDKHSKSCGRRKRYSLACFSWVHTFFLQVIKRVSQIAAYGWGWG